MVSSGNSDGESTNAAIAGLVGGLNTLVIAGVASVAVCLLCALLLLLLFIQRRRRRRKQRDALGLSNSPSSAVNALAVIPGSGVENPLAKYRRESASARAADMMGSDRTVAGFIATSHQARIRRDAASRDPC